MRRLSVITHRAHESLKRWGKGERNTLKIHFGVLLLVASAATAAPMVWSSGGVTVTLDVIPHSLLSPGPITSDGVGNYLAFAGVGDNPWQTTWDLVWNFTNASNSAVTFKLMWDTDPASALQVANSGFLQQTIGAGSSTGAQWNGGSQFLGTGVPIQNVYAPAVGGGINPDAIGVYTWSLQVNTAGIWGGPVIQITTLPTNLGAQAPEPNPGLLLVAGLGLFLTLRRCWRLR